MHFYCPSIGHALMIHHTPCTWVIVMLNEIKRPLTLARAKVIKSDTDSIGHCKSTNIRPHPFLVEYYSTCTNRHSNRSSQSVSPSAHHMCGIMYKSKSSSDHWVKVPSPTPKLAREHGAAFDRKCQRDRGSIYHDLFKEWWLQSKWVG
jgi:hypothetical protein